MSAPQRPLLAITMGDPAGVGPEVVVAALGSRRARAAGRALVIGDGRALARAAASRGAVFTPRTVSGAREALTGRSPICLLDLRNADPDQISLGQLSAAAGRAAADYIEKAVELARAGEVAAVVTAPINKEALRKAGVAHPGHTEMLAALCGVKRVGMMLVHGEMRVSHVTTHLALRDACEIITQERVLSAIRLTDEALCRMGTARAHIAVAGLNPHAGEGGLFGEEEIEVIAPAVEAARAEGINATGPLPPDTVFARHRAGEFDAVVAMVHDHGHIAMKTVGFRKRKGGGLTSAGVNVTLGLPIIRTSVDHGTAFDIAGKGIADPTSMVEAIVLAARMACQRPGQEAGFGPAK
ncbi:MAG: 4-hydroxythreonine-4-phosphate dehydrogenase PdxA [Armatimonadota bacterium]